MQSGDMDAIFIFKLCTQTPKKEMSKFFENLVLMEIFLQNFTPVYDSLEKEKLKAPA